MLFRSAFAASADAWALSLNAFAGLLISPISWSHHWVWGETAVLTLAVLGWRGLARNRGGDREHSGRTGWRGRARNPGQDRGEPPGRTAARPDGIALTAGLPCLALAAVGAIMFAVSPQWWFPGGGNRELHWAAWEQAAGSSYVIFAAVVLLTACIVAPTAAGEGAG